MRASSILIAVTVLGALAACSGETGSADSGTPSAAVPTSTPSASPSASPSGRPSADPTATPSASPTPTPTRPKPKPEPSTARPADGTNLAACRDARCEVSVKTGTRIPVKRSVAGFSTLVVSEVGADGVDFGGSTANTSVSAGGQQAGFTFQLNGLKVTTVAVTGGTAILRLRPA